MSAIVWIVLLALYLVLAGAVDPVEIGAGLISASAGTLLAIGVSRVARRHYTFGPPARALLSPFASLLPDTLSVGVDLVRVALDGARGQRGVFVRQPFEPGADEAASAGRRALVVLGLSLSPRGFVIRGERQDVLVLHTLPPKPAATDTRWPA